MSSLFSVVGIPFGWVMWALYQVISNYGVAIILFAIVTKALLLPLTIKQQKSTARTALLSPKLEKLKKKYGNDKQKYQEEMMKLYQAEGVNPMGSCGTLLIQIPLLFGIIDVVYKPLTHIARFSKDTIAALVNFANQIGTSIEGYKVISQNDYQAQIKAVNIFQQHPEQFQALGSSQLDTFSAISAKLDTIDLNFLGMNFGATPAWNNILLIIAIFSGITAFASSIVSQRVSAKNNPAMQMQGSMKMMIYLMPLMSFFIAFSFPAGVGFYWGVSNLLMIAQTVILARIYTPDKLRAIAELEAEKKRKVRGIKAYEIEDDDDKAAGDKKNTGEKKADTKKLSQKELDRRRLAEARKRDAEKYGEEYVDVTDEDLR